MDILFLYFNFALLGTVLTFGKSELTYPSAKNWWAKKITSDLYTAGRLTAEQYKYAYETGFRTIISQFTFTSAVKMGKDVKITTDTAREIVHNSTDMEFHVLLEPAKSWATLETLRKFTSVYEKAPKPVLYTGGSGYSTSFIALLYTADASLADPSAEHKVDIDEVFRRGAALGYDYTRSALLKMASNVTGQPVPEFPTKPEVDFAEWNRPLWYFKPVLKNWFIAGQIRKSWIHYMENAGFKAVVNVRAGLKTSGNKSQEEVPLLNIRDGTGTYTDGGRQSPKRLRATRLHPDKPPQYVSPTSKVNYAARNPLCFGDAVGYNELLERKAVKKTPMKYIHLPIPANTSDWKEMWEKYRDKLKKASELDGPVLVHCAALVRSGVMTLLAAGQENGRDAAWATRRAAELGIPLSDDPDVLAVLTDVLGSTAPSRTASVVLLLLCTTYLVGLL